MTLFMKSSLSELVQICVLLLYMRPQKNTIFGLVMVWSTCSKGSGSQSTPRFSSLRRRLRNRDFTHPTQSRNSSAIGAERTMRRKCSYLAAYGKGAKSQVQSISRFLISLVKAKPRRSSSLILLKVLFVILEAQNSGGIQGIIMGIREHPSGGLQRVGWSCKLTGKGQGQWENVLKNKENKVLALAFGCLRQTYAARIAKWIPAKKPSRWQWSPLFLAHSLRHRNRTWNFCIKTPEKGNS